MSDGRRILVINPNSSESVTAAIDAAMAPLRRPEGPAITVAGLAEGPPGIATQRDADSVVMPLVAWVQRDDADAFVLACFSDPGLHAVREAAGGRPVMGIAEWGILRAMTLGERFGIIALSPSSIRRQQRMVRQMAVHGRYAGSVPVDLSAAETADASVGSKLAEAGRILVRQHGADVVVLGCAGMASHRAPIEAAIGCPVIEPSQQATAAAIAAFVADAGGMTSTAIFGRWVLARREGRQEVLRDHWVLIEGSRIAAVTPSRPMADRIFDAPGRFVLPGLMNLHNHCFSEAVARSHTEDGNGRSNNRSIVYTVLMPLTRRGLEILLPSERMDIARLGILQLLKGGATSVMEPFRNGIPEMFDAAAEMGIRFWGAPYLFSTADAVAGEDGQTRYTGNDGVADLDAWNGLYARWHGAAGERIQLAMSPHATDTCGPDLLRACALRARELGVPITTHLAQSPAEVATIGARYDGRTPAECLDWLGLLAPDLLAAHCIACSDADLRLMAARGATVLNCPRVFARAGTVAAFGRFASHGVRTVVGTDGYNMDLLGELNAASMISKIAAGQPDIASAPELIDAVTSTAAAVVGRPDLGHLAPGATADLTVIDMTHPQLHPMADPRRGLIALANRADVAQIFVDGRLLIDAGGLVTGDEQAVCTAGAAAIERIWDLPEARAALPR